MLETAPEKQLSKHTSIQTKCTIHANIIMVIHHTSTYVTLFTFYPVFILRAS